MQSFHILHDTAAWFVTKFGCFYLWVNCLKTMIEVVFCTGFVLLTYTVLIGIWMLLGPNTGTSYITLRPDFGISLFLAFLSCHRHCQQCDIRVVDGTGHWLCLHCLTVVLKWLFLVCLFCQIPWHLVLGP